MLGEGHAKSPPARTKLRGGHGKGPPVAYLRRVAALHVSVFVLRVTRWRCRAQARKYHGELVGWAVVDGVESVAWQKRDGRSQK